MKQLLILFAFLFIPLRLYSQTHVDADSVLNSIQMIGDDKERLKALVDFQRKYTDFANADGLRISLFSTALAIKDSNLTLQFALDYLKNASELTSAYNRVAYQLAEQSLLLDSALSFIDRANIDYEKAQGRKRVPYMDTKAFVHYKRGEFKQALETQKEALAIWPKDHEWDPNYAEYYYYLALYMYKNGIKDESLKLMARTSFFGFEDATKTLDEILKSENAGMDKISVYRSAAEEYIDATPDKNTARSIIAMGWAKQNILLDRALEYAQAGVNAIDENTEFDEQSSRYTTLGVVNVIKGDYEKGILQLEHAKKFGSPYNIDLYFYLGKAYESLNDEKKAFQAYLGGVVGYKEPALLEKLTALHRKLYPDGPSLDEIISAEKKTIENFRVEEYKKPSDNQKVVLAELFTGSECGPCLAADIAYDKLLERYNSKSLAVLEYHQHIPAPDPMTNTDSEERAKFYKVNSTPTSIIDGVDKSLSGGPKAASKNRFDVFSATVEKYLTKPPKVKINIKAKFSKDKIAIDCNASLTEMNRKDIVLHVVLAEDKVGFIGRNTVSEHRFVVRKMFPSPNGTDLGNGKDFKFSTVSSIKTIEDSLRNYLDGMEKKAGRKVFKEKKFNINYKNLYIVAFVQNTVTKEVLQAEMRKVSR
jgi:tetratricopeptide (TPR) repeat protein